VSPILRGMLGLETDAIHRSVKLTPHVPADWTQFSIENVRLGKNTLLFHYNKTEGEIVLETGLTSGNEECTVEFRPAISLRAKVQRVELNGKAVPFQVETRAGDQHIVVQFPVTSGKYSLRIRLLNDFGLSEASNLPALGSASLGLRVLSEAWSASRNQLTLEVSGAAGSEYGLKVWNSGEIQSVEGAEFTPSVARIGIRIPGSDSELYPHVKVVIHFSMGQKKGNAGKR
jgi:hypothetical protein